MTGLEVAGVALGAAIVKSAIKIWLADKKIAADVAVNAVDIVSGRTTSLLEKRRMNRMFDQMADLVAAKVRPLIEVEFRNVPENERIATINAVKDTFDQAPLSDEDLFAHDLNAGYVDRYLRQQVPNMANKALLATEARPMYDLLLRECCEYIVQITMALPRFQTGILTEILRRETEIITTLDEILSRLPQRRVGRSGSDFEVDYRRQVTNSLDRMELFGATLSESTRRYPLSVAYVSLTLLQESDASTSSRDESKASISEKMTTTTTTTTTTGIRVERALKGISRVFLRGIAGCGKTTLLRWIAVRCAQGDLPEQVSDWSDKIPFYIPLRRYVDTYPPAPEKFLESVGRHISDEMPRGWVQEQLRAGRAVVLVDGVDELPKAQRERARDWLGELIGAFPDAHYYVTSRSAVETPNWLQSEGFAPFELQPMSPADVRAFIHQWHEAMKSENTDPDDQRRLDEYESRLIGEIVSKRHLRSLAETPLLCALLCALHHDRRAQLPSNRLELYEVALEMLLERREVERNIATDMLLSRTDKTLLLQDIAYWLVRNGWSDAERTRVIERIDIKLPQMARISDPAEEIYRHLLERSGLIREPIEGRVDFVHRTFQEYLAALDALANGDIGLLIENAHQDEWREVVIMAAGHAYARTREELMGALINRADKDRQYRDQLHLLAVACLETSPELSVDMQEQIRMRVAELLPPPNMTAAKSLAAAGDFVIDLLAKSRPANARAAAATIRAAADIGSEPALQVIAQYKRDTRITVQKELLQAWPRFNPEDYARMIIRHSLIVRDPLAIDNPDLVPALKYLVDLQHLEMYLPGRPVDITALAELTQLETLRITSTAILDVSSLANLLNLNRLVLIGSTVTDLSPIVGLTNLTYLESHSKCWEVT